MSLGSRLQRLQLGRLRAPGVLLMGSGGHRARSSRSDTWTSSKTQMDQTPIPTGLTIKINPPKKGRTKNTQNIGLIYGKSAPPLRNVIWSCVLGIESRSRQNKKMFVMVSPNHASNHCVYPMTSWSQSIPPYPQSTPKSLAPSGLEHERWGST
jgi:hypothetical protein